MITKFTKSVCFAALFAIAVVAASPSEAFAATHPTTSTCKTTKGFYWKTITVYVCKTVPYTVKVRHVKPCGTVDYTYLTKYKTIQVPVQKRVKVWY